MAATEYDARILQMFADRLYAQARNMTVVMTVLFGVIGGVAGLVLGSTAAGEGAGVLLALCAAVFLGLLGFALGRGRTFALRLQAQTVLCQVRIERNTRALSQKVEG